MTQRLAKHGAQPFEQDLVGNAGGNEIARLHHIAPGIAGISPQIQHRALEPRHRAFQDRAPRRHQAGIAIEANSHAPA
ncbi:MAG: hypothetical protein B7Z23_14135, partial [Pseudomonadales bacterium 32-61-5]